jgi:hypothetical protein
LKNASEIFMQKQKLKSRGEKETQGVGREKFTKSSKKY